MGPGLPVVFVSLCQAHGGARSRQRPGSVLRSASIAMRVQRLSYHRRRLAAVRLPLFSCNVQNSKKKFGTFFFRIEVMPHFHWQTETQKVHSRRRYKKERQRSRPKRTRVLKIERKPRRITVPGFLGSRESNKILITATEQN